jgi:hypothetical protein
MPEITSANDIELVIERGSRISTTDTSSPMGRMVVDEFSLSREQGSDHVPSVGENTAVGYYEGVSMWSFSWTMMGDDIDTFEIVTQDDGASQEFSFTARKVNDDGSVAWEEALISCTLTSEEKSASADEALEYSVEGIGVGYDREL